ncbi:heterokaryon incompatibility protein-domain-containing protein [Paraphoma chrysanthemicola]|uniref:Heterokaryon incompatibility protein-domain-containing protein n=1 Tax=Paraphoma chrysanthemicola TaxID=798071 RepID=A0A8K0QZD2_9PLEO|nr:heterokaryon incompatibility protein-domain-containing protein [Paraphoma chrysanthemicola]
MRLINTATLVIEEFNPRNVPPYAILSHTWEEEEMSLQEMRFAPFTTKKGYVKIQKCCAQAAADGFTHCWIDTCCIDKTSSAEFSEAINSMFQWYQDSSICYALLSDCFDDCKVWNAETIKHFADSRWWTRGWTLQELLAPKVVEFYNAEWRRIGSRNSTRKHVSYASGIHEDMLCGQDVTTCDVAVRMSWAAKRQTTRVEDQAYCLMGLFNVNMPLLYGEGFQAFTRLQEEILRVTEDYSLFLWQIDPELSSCALFADSPADFFTRLKVDEWSFRWHRRTLSPSGLRHTVLSADFASNCYRSCPPPNNHGPPSIASRAVRLHLPLVRMRGGSVVCFSETKPGRQNDGFLVCLQISLSPGAPVGSRSSIILVQKRFRSRFKYETIHLSIGGFGRIPLYRSLKCDFELLIFSYDTSMFQMLSTSIEKAVEGALFVWDRSLKDILNLSEPPSFDSAYKSFTTLPEGHRTMVCMQRDPSDCFVVRSAGHGLYANFTFTFNGNANLEQTLLLHLASSMDQVYCRLENPSIKQPEDKRRPLTRLVLGAEGSPFKASHDNLTLTADQQHTPEDPDRVGTMEVTAGVRSVAPAILHGALCSRYVLSLTHQLTPASAQND